MMNGIEMWGIIDAVWGTIEETSNKFKKEYPELVFHSEKKEEFNKLYQKKYHEVMNCYMSSETTALDSHKQAALLTICCLELDVIEHPVNDAEKISIAPQLIAIDVGLSFMLNCLNRLLWKKKIKKEIERYYLPIATACDTPYVEIACRLLFLEQREQDMSFNVLELADRFFLLEYINLLQHGVDISLLKEVTEK